MAKKGKTNGPTNVPQIEDLDTQAFLAAMAEAELNKGATFYFTLDTRDMEKLEAENRNTSGGRSEVA